MHEYQRAERAHRRVYARQDKGGDQTTTANAQTTLTTATSTSAIAKTTSSSSTAATTTSTAAKAATTTSSVATTTSTDSPLIDISSIFGFTSDIGKPTSTTTTSSTSSTLSKTSSSSSTSSTPPAMTTTSSLTSSTAARHLSTSTATLTSSNTAAAASSTATSTAHGGLSGAETGGIIAGCVLAGFALLVFAIRKTFIQRRKRKRNTWGAGVYPDINDKYSDGAADLPPPPLPEKAPASTGGYLEPRMPIWAPPRPVSPNPSPSSMMPPPPPPANYYIQPPQASYNNAIMDAAPVVAPAGVPISSFGAVSNAGETATVRVLYIPTLPDELSITTGEMVYIIQAYDDGWALCSNVRGEQGVVPLECLDRTGQSQGDRLSVGNGQHESGGDWRNMKRMSSLSAQ